MEIVDNKKISFEELTDLINQYANGTKAQTTPQIIWFDNNAELVKYRDVPGFASYLGCSNDRIVFYEKSGSPLTDHDRLKDGTMITNEMRLSFCLTNLIKFDDHRNLYSRLFIHSPFTCYIGDNGLTSLEYCIMLHENLHMPVILMYPLQYREKIIAEGSIDGYEELMCVDTVEEYVRKWLSFAENTVNNFYLDFLKASPWHHITSKMDPRYVDVNFNTTYCSPVKWEDASKNCAYYLIEIIESLLPDEIKNEEISDFVSLINDNKICFERFQKILELIPEEIWIQWQDSDDGYFAMKANPRLTKESPRIMFVKSYMCSFAMDNNIPEETINALLAYHHL